MIETARALKNKRNENIHGVWGEMIDAQSGTFVGVTRSRYEKDRPSKSAKWDLTVPTVKDLDTLAGSLDKIARALNERMANLWDIDVEVSRWRDQHGYS